MSVSRFGLVERRHVSHLKLARKKQAKEVEGEGEGETNGGSNVWEEFVAYLRFGSTLTPLYAFNSPSFFLAISILIPDRCLHCNKEWLKKRRERRQVNKIEIGRCHR